MNKIITPTNGPLNDGDGSSVSELLAALSTERYQHLIGFARWRLRKASTSPWLQQCLAIVDAEDLVDEAVLKVRLGEEDPALGRHLKPEHRNPVGFVACLKGIISSDLYHLVHQTLSRCRHVSIGDPETYPDDVDPADPRDTSALLSRRDLHRVLFPRLYARAVGQPCLLAIIREWDDEFLALDRIPREGHSRTMIHRVRRLAREILAELEPESMLPPAQGREMLL